MKSMSIKTSKENICVNQIIGQKEEIIRVEGDEIVPDIKPDVLSIVSSTGTVCIYKKEIQDGKVRFDGSIYIYTIYMADDETSSIRSINSSLDFSKTIEVSNITQDMQLEDYCQIQSIDCKILNGRKINLEVSMKMQVKVYSNNNVEIINDIAEINDIQKLEKSYTINSLLGSGSTKVIAKDTVNINQEDNLSEIIKVKVDIKNKETKISYNKILAKADNVVNILYLTEDNRIGTVSAVIPVMGFIDMQNINEQNLCDVSYELRNIAIKPNNVDEHSIYIESEIEITGLVYENKEMRIIQDLYSPSTELECKQKKIKVMQNKRSIKQICNIRKQEMIQEIGKNKIYDVDVRPVIINTQTINGRVSYEGELNLRILFANENNTQLQRKDIVEPFTFNIADEQVTVNTSIETYMEVKMQDFIVMPDESIDMKIDLEFNLSISNTEDLNIIDEINNVENRNREKYSIVIYYIRKGDTLWKIAKRFGSTMDDIIRVNKIENPDVILPGQQLFIPR